MRLHFSTSFGFDNVYPKLVSKSGTAIHGQLQVGVKGLLEWFEMHLGLGREDTSDLLRISQYKKALSKALAEQPTLYIVNSYKVDAWGTAKQLLRWRDELILALWDFDCDDKGVQRLYTLSIIEDFVQELPAGVNDRWRSILEAIEQKKDLPFLETVTIYEPEATFNPFFIKLVGTLQNCGVQIIFKAPSYKAPSYKSNKSDLDIFKSKLLGQAKTNKAVPHNDGSLTLIKADNAKLIAEALSAQLKLNPGLNPLLIIPDSGELLEQAMINKGLPAMGYTATFENGALSQLLILMSLFLWEPLDPEKLIQFLSIQVAPVDKALRARLAQAYARTPGVGNEEWTKTIDKYKKQYPKSADKTQQKLDLWFARQSYPIKEGAPATTIINLYTDLKKWADTYGSQLGDEDNKANALKQLSSQCRTLIQVIESEQKGETLIDAVALTKWIEELSSFSHSKAQQAELGSYSHVSSSAVISDTVDAIVWWNFLESVNPLAHTANWSATEMQVLSGAHIHTAKMKLDLWYWELCNGILSCDKQLILCIPEKSKGEPSKVNQLYYDLEATFTELNSLTTDIDINKSQSLLGKKIATTTFPAKSLPQRQAAWQLSSTQSLEKREQESYSSLSKLFFHPYAYVLKYLLNIKPKEIPQLTISPLLLGNLTHDTAEALWGDKELLNYDAKKLTTEVHRVLEENIQKSGIILLMPKNKTSLQEYRDKATKSLLHLIKIIKDNGWTVLESEQKHTLAGVLPLQGFVDLVLQRDNKGNKEIAIVDLKWGGASSRRLELIEERELQLIIYDRLLKQKDRRIHLHYYIISSNKMLGRNNAAFAETITIDLTEEELTHRKAIWDKMVNTYKLRWEQIAEGALEVGDGMFVSEIEGCKELYSHEEAYENYLKILVKANKKEEDKYSDYNNFIGAI